MASIIISCSVSGEEKEFLETYNLSPTQLLKEKIWEMRGIFRNLVQNKIEKMSKVISQQAEHIERLENVQKEKDRANKF